MPYLGSAHLKHRMGRSPITGYTLFDEGASFELQALRGNNGGLTRQWVRLPKDPEDLARVICAIIKASGNTLTLQACLVGELAKKKEER